MTDLDSETQKLIIQAAITVFTAIIAALVAVGGWVAAHILTAKRDTLNKRRDMRVQYLISAYR